MCSPGLSWRIALALRKGNRQWGEKGGGGGGGERCGIPACVIESTGSND